MQEAMRSAYIAYMVDIELSIHKIESIANRSEKEEIELIENKDLLIHLNELFERGSCNKCQDCRPGR